ncbi:MAG: hypothetical protein ABIN83_07585 [Sphingomicrobium sp.]
MIAIPLIMGAVMTALRFWMFYAGTSMIRGKRRATNVDDGDAHLSFDARIAERLRELEHERHQPVTNSAALPTQSLPQRSFGRREV